MTNKAQANYNMEFDNGKFEKGKEYHFRREYNIFFVTTEQGKEQEFFYTEFNTFFTLVEN